MYFKMIILIESVYKHFININKLNENNIFIFRSAALGDFVMSIPTINLIRKRYSSADITLVTLQSGNKKQKEKVEKYAKKDKLPWIKLMEEGIVDNVIQIKTLNLYKLRKTLGAEIKRLQPQKCFLLVEPGTPKKNMLKKILMFRFCGMKCPIFGWKNRASGACNKDNKMKRQQQFKAGLFKHHVLGLIESIVEGDNLKEVKINFDVHLESEEKKWVDSFWKENHLETKRVIIISPGSVQPHKRWPIQNFNRIIRYLLKDNENIILITGIKNKENLGKQLKEINPQKVIDLEGKTSISRLAAILSKAYLLIGNDGGTMHLGDAVGCTVISIMPGLEYPNSAEPWHNVGNAVRYPTACSPCYSFEKCLQKHNQCMVGFPTDIVIEKINNIIYKSKNEKKQLNSRKFKVLYRDNNIFFREII